MVFNLRSFSSTESVEDDLTPPKSFSLEELRVATDNFSRHNFWALGNNYEVYQGRLADGSLVAIKRESFVNRQREEEFEEEVRVGSRVSTHPNVLCLRGFCRTKKELLLVYPLMVNNSLSYNLRERPDRFARPLDWSTRKRVALGTMWKKKQSDCSDWQCCAQTRIHPFDHKCLKWFKCSRASFFSGTQVQGIVGVKASAIQLRTTLCSVTQLRSTLCLLLLVLLLLIWGLLHDSHAKFRHHRRLLLSITS